jgi:hypothetical protein
MNRDRDLSLTRSQFISAASFQETTRVLTEASISGKVDPPSAEAMAGKSSARLTVPEV